MAEMIQLSPMNMALILAVISSGLIGCLWGWRHSIRTRKLVKFSLLLLFVLVGVIILRSIFGPRYVL